MDFIRAIERNKNEIKDTNLQFSLELFIPWHHGMPERHDKFEILIYRILSLDHNASYNIEKN